MLLVHGTLHLLGWDHETAAKDRKMKAETARLVALASATVRAKPTRKRAKTPTKTATKRRTVTGVTRRPGR
jgi:probable rRNA maturation factor